MMYLLIAATVTVVVIFNLAWFRHEQIADDHRYPPGMP